MLQLLSHKNSFSELSVNIANAFFIGNIFISQDGCAIYVSINSE